MTECRSARARAKASQTVEDGRRHRRIMKVGRAASQREHRAALHHPPRIAGRRSCRRSAPTSASTSHARSSSATDARALARARERSRAANPVDRVFPREVPIVVGMAAAVVEHHGGEIPAPWRSSSRCRASAERRRTLSSATRWACPACRSIATCCGSRTGSASPARTSRIVEQQLDAAMPRAAWTRTSDTLILHGGDLPRPLCDRCAVRDECHYYHKSCGRRDERAVFS